MVNQGPLRGQVWEYIVGSAQRRVVIVSNDDYNALPNHAPWGLLIEPKTDGPTIFTVPMSAEDPIPAGSVMVPIIMRCQITGLRRCLGYLSETTYTELERALREFLELP